MKETFYVKSFPPEFELKTLENAPGLDKARLVTTQTIGNIMDTLSIKPNTLSFAWPPRLCTTILDADYLKTYRPQGLIFTLSNGEKPDYIFPFDLNVLTENNDPVVEYYAIKDEIHKHYNVKLIDDFMAFSSGSYDEMFDKFKNSNGQIDHDKILKLVNDFRLSRGLNALDESKRKLVEYNEAIFLRPVKIKPIAIFGDKNNPIYQNLSKTYNLPIYDSSEDFYFKNR